MAEVIKEFVWLKLLRNMLAEVINQGICMAEISKDFVWQKY